MRHLNGCRCTACRRDIAAFESRALKGDAVAVAVVAAIAGAIWFALVPLRIWHVTGTDGREHPDAATWIAYGISAGLLLAVLMFFSIRMTAEPARRAPVRVPATVPAALGIATALEAEPPACGHFHAVEVENLLYLREPPWAYLCPECGEKLPGEFGDLMRSCCGTKPGRDHWYTCVNAARWHELNVPHRKG